MFLKKLQSTIIITRVRDKIHQKMSSNCLVFSTKTDNAYGLFSKKQHTVSSEMTQCHNGHYFII